MKPVLASLAVAACLAAVSVPAQAAIVISIKEVGADVDMVGYGSANLAALTFVTAVPVGTPEISSLTGSAVVGAQASLMDVYTGLIGPANFGSRLTTPLGTGSGTPFGIKRGALVVPSLYVSGTSLGTSTAVFSNETFADLRVIPGTYVWTWGQGADADSLTVNIGVPEPATWVMMLAGFGGLGANLRRRREIAADAGC